MLIERIRSMASRLINQRPQTVIHYQSFDGHTVGGGTIHTPGTVDLTTARVMACLDAGDNATNVDVTSVVTPDSRELVTE